MSVLGSSTRSVLRAAPLVMLILAGCDDRQPDPRSATAAPASGPSSSAGGADAAVGAFEPGPEYSNITRADYVGPQVCGECHNENFQSWQTHSHSKMNQNADAATVRGDFSGARLAYGPGEVVFGRDGADFMMSLYKAGNVIRRFKVTRTVGSLYMQYYIGLQIFGPEPLEHLAYRTECKLPFAYCYELKRWLPELYLDTTMGPETEAYKAALFDDAPSHPWNSNCLNCHNTYPYEARLWDWDGDFWRGGFPERSVRFNASWQDENRPLDPDELVTVGISCESCHFGGREHAIHGKPIRFLPTSPRLAIEKERGADPTRSDRQNPFVVNSICMQCHNAGLFKYPNGGCMVNSSEALDQALGGCASQIKCTDCHNPHQPGPGTGAPADPKHITACLNCHKDYQAPEALAAHSRHSQSVTCLDCHMPRSVAGLDRVTRSHQITSPSDVVMLANGKPNACNVCHLDKPLLWTIAELNKGWGIGLNPRRAWAASYGGSLKTPVGGAWLNSPDRYVRMVAADAYARTTLVSPRDAARQILRSLDDRFAANRLFGLLALQDLLGRPIDPSDYDVIAPPETRQQMIARLRAELSDPLAARHDRTAASDTFQAVHRGTLPAGPKP